MKKPEAAPKWSDDKLYNQAIKLKTQHDLSDLIRKINDNYLYWDKVKYQHTATNVAPELLWVLTKLSRVLNAKKIQIGSCSFCYNVTDKIQKALHEFDRNFGGSLGSQSVIPEQDKNRYLISSIMEEAIASSQIEGAVTTRKQAKELLRKNSKPKNKSEQMIFNNYLTIKRIVEIKDEPLTLERLLEIHKLITSDTLNDPTDEGAYRNNNDVAVVDAANDEVLYTPPAFEQVPEIMSELFKFFNHNDEEVFIHPVIKGCVIHFLIGFFHPFVDGNGRTARALFYWYLLKNGYCLTEYLSISRLIVKSKTQYAQAYLYTEIDNNDLTYFIDYKIKTLQLAFAELNKYILRKISEKRSIINFQKLDGVNERQALILKWISEEPDQIFTVKEIETRFNISNQTARSDLDSLVALNYLENIDLNKKTKGFGNGKLLRIKT